MIRQKLICNLEGVEIDLAVMFSRKGRHGNPELPVLSSTHAKRKVSHYGLLLRHRKCGVTGVLTISVGSLSRILAQVCVWHLTVRAEAK